MHCFDSLKTGAKLGGTFLESAISGNLFGWPFGKGYMPPYHFRDYTILIQEVEYFVSQEVAVAVAV